MRPGELHTLVATGWEDVAVQLGRWAHAVLRRGLVASASWAWPTILLPRWRPSSAGMTVVAGGVNVAGDMKKEIERSDRRR